jgi:mono/diheme cytochrome c family protein
MIVRSNFHKSTVLLLVAACVALGGGCQKSPAPRFQLNMVALAEAEMAGTEQPTREQQETIANVLEALFGTPDEPYVPEEKDPDGKIVNHTNLDLKKLQMAAGPVRQDRAGRRLGLFREHCVHCHGISGDGMGPTAAFLKPYPRDYRQGKFKFKSTERAEMPTDEDLAKVVRHGIPGTAMPAFEVSLAQPEVDALVEYVKYLSLRGQAELSLIIQIQNLSTGDKLPMDREMLIDTVLLPEVEKWSTAGQKIIQAPPPPENFGTPESIDKGRELFYSEQKANCVKCHGPTGLGDGTRDDFDDWSKQVVTLTASIRRSLDQIDEEWESGEGDTAELRQRRAAEERKLALIEAHSLQPRTIDPRNLRLGVYRGGRRPIDLYYRVFAGINAVPMPGTAGPAVTNEEMWHIVDYVMSLPYEAGGELGVERTMLARERN